MSFKKTKYKIIKEAIPKELAKFIYTYLKKKRKVARFLSDRKFVVHGGEWGGWTDPQVLNTYSVYADTVMETLLEVLKVKMEKETGYKLNETYSYARIYKKGDVLHRHTDRNACEVSATLHLGGDPWPLYLDPTGKRGQAGIPVDLATGEMLLYSGCNLEHWREEFRGKDCAQVFLHYNDAKKKDAKETKFDRRPFVGVPAYFRQRKI